MKICITSAGPDLDSFVDPRFGRAMYFIILDEEGNIIKSIKNNAALATVGAGTMSAQTLVNEKVNILITANVGPNALYALNASGIKIFIASPGLKIRDAFTAYKKGGLQELSQNIPPSPSFRPGFRRGKGGGRWRQRRGWGHF